ncbi:hypothetical protein [Caenimonas sp. SL110]|uniref:hypothetical protein n=1 Tax=Caenimonas sp. SL110 TaxID=1450524 RepID=UPI0006547746|nr:hypothetical protein [Caenimonas sp. SL110]
MTTHHAATIDPSAQSHLHAYNAAFEELDLPWHWDAVTFMRLRESGDCCVRRYLETEHAHLLRAYDADFLVQAVETARKRCHAVLAS